MTPKITMTDRPEAAMRRAILDPLVQFNAVQAGKPEDYRPLAILRSEEHTSELQSPC